MDRADHIALRHLPPVAVLGVFIGSLVTTEAAFPVVTGLMFLLGYFGGLFIPVDQRSGWFQFVAHLMPSYRQVSLAIASLDVYTLALTQWLVLVGCVAVLGLVIVWKHRVEEARASPD